jgi:hypothetical protein
MNRMAEKERVARVTKVIAGCPKSFDDAVNLRLCKGEQDLKGHHWNACHRVSSGVGGAHFSSTADQESAGKMLCRLQSGESVVKHIGSYSKLSTHQTHSECETA